MKTILRSLLCVILLWLTHDTHAQVIKLNSYPAATGVIFLDFDGHYVTGTSWNWSGPISAAASGFSNTAIEEIFNRVAEDFRPFNINITTDSTVYFAAPVRQRTRVIVTPTSAWYGNAGGAAWVGSFTWGDDTPCFVFPNKLSYSTKNVGEACSHEAGHTLGLQHQSRFNESCALIEEYNSGKGTGEISWAPIMGNSYSRNLTTWTKGTSAFGCNYIQDDIKTITSFANKISFRADDHADHIEAAEPIPTSGNSLAASGILTRLDDKDVFSLTLTQPSILQINAVPYTVNSNNSGANLDIKLSMIGSNGDTLASFNPPDKLSAAIDSFVQPGTYYFAVDGVGNSYLSDTSSIGFYNITGVFVANGILPVHNIRLTGHQSGSKHILQWKITGDEPGYNAELQVSKDGTRFETVFQSDHSNSYTYTPETPGPHHYRLRVKGAHAAQHHYSNTVVIKGDPVKTAEVHALGNGNYQINVSRAAEYLLMDPSGRMISKGRLNKGSNQFSLSSAGVFLLKIQDGMSSHTEKLMKQ